LLFIRNFSLPQNSKFKIFTIRKSLLLLLLHIFMLTIAYLSNVCIIGFKCAPTKLIYEWKRIIYVYVIPCAQEFIKISAAVNQRAAASKKRLCSRELLQWSSFLRLPLTHSLWNTPELHSPIIHSLRHILFQAALRAK